MDEALEPRPADVSRETGARQAPRRIMFDVPEEDNSLHTPDGAVAPAPNSVFGTPHSPTPTPTSSTHGDHLAATTQTDQQSPGSTPEESGSATRSAEPKPQGTGSSGTLPTHDPSQGSNVSRETSGHDAPRLPSPRSTRIFVVANQKGGVGKTTTTVNLATALAAGGLRVLVIDMDPQGNASTALGIDHEPGTPGTYEVLIDGDPIARHVVQSDEAPNLWVLPATIDLAGTEIQLVSMVSRETRLRRALDTLLRSHEVDYVLFDCPPSLGLLTLNALVAAKELLLPIQCEYYALEGVSQLVNTINLVKGELNDDLRLTTVLMTMFDRRTNLSAQVVEEVRQYFPDVTLPVVIPRSVRIAEAPSYNQSVLTYDPRSAGARAYIDAAAEIARRGAEEPR